MQGAGVAVVDRKMGALYPGVEALITADAGVCRGIRAADLCSEFLAALPAYGSDWFTLALKGVLLELPARLWARCLGVSGAGLRMSHRY